MRAIRRRGVRPAAGRAGGELPSLPAPRPLPDPAAAQPLLDIEALDRALDAAASDAAGVARAHVVAAIKPVIAAGRATIERRFMETQIGAEAVAAHAVLMDTVIQSLHRVIRSQI